MEQADSATNQGLTAADMARISCILNTAIECYEDRQICAQSALEYTRRALDIANRWLADYEAGRKDGAS